MARRQCRFVKRVSMKSVGRRTARGKMDSKWANNVTPEKTRYAWFDYKWSWSYFVKSTHVRVPTIHRRWDLLNERCPRRVSQRNPTWTLSAVTSSSRCVAIGKLRTTVGKLRKTDERQDAGFSVTLLWEHCVCRWQSTHSFLMAATLVSL